MPGENSLSSVEHVVVLMLENRSFDHMLGYLYSDSGNVSLHAELVSRQFPAGVSTAPGLAGPAPATAAALSSYIRAHA